MRSVDSFPPYSISFPTKRYPLRFHISTPQTARRDKKYSYKKTEATASVFYISFLFSAFYFRTTNQSRVGSVFPSNFRYAGNHVHLIFFDAKLDFRIILSFL